MFEDLNKTKGVEDIFSSTDQSLKEMPKPPVFQPKTATPTLPSATGRAGGLKEKLAGLDKKYFLVGLVVLLFVIVVGGGFWGLRKYNPFSGSGQNAGDETVMENSAENSGVDNSVSPAAEENKETVAETATPLPPDSDQDGLTDDEEKELKTNAENIDSDADGLFDREEVKVYGTNPLKADTDGDGYQDGAEVKNGYNPKGEGKLYEVK